MTQLSPNIKSRAVSGMLWSSGGSFAFQFIRIITQIILARMLWPEAFGTVALAMAFVTVVNYLIDNGLTLYYIRVPEIGEHDAYTLWISNIGLSLIAVFMFMLLGPYLTEVFKLDIIPMVLLLSSIAIVLNAISTVHRAVLTRAIQFKTQTLYQLIAAITSGVIAVTSAYLSFGLWSLVIYNVSYQFILSMLLVIGVKVSFDRKFDTKFFRSSLIYSWKLMLSGLIHTLYENILNIMMANLYSVSTLGYYSNALKIRDGAAQTLSDSIQKVSFPVLSQIQSDKDAMHQNSSKILRLSIFIIFPILIGLAASSEAIVKVVFNEQWIDMIPILQLLALNGLLIPLHKVNLNVLTVMGRTDLYLRLEIYKKVFGFTSLILVLYVQWSLSALLWILFLNAVFGYVINIRYTGQLIGYGYGHQFKDLFNITLVSVLMGIIVFGLNWLNVSNLITLLIQVIIGVLSYIILSSLFCRNEFTEVLGLIKRIMKK